ncbi:MAG: pyruvate dehydrogenase complex E1 component subunit beta, partial [Sphingomonadaceae bacterium]|nr:pyruvate dehydrogenase complex E1 component subunit beta [Sphingomonadaceae bacterium]
MAIELKMPALSPTMEEGTLARWLKSEGDEIAPGDIIAEIETDKATMEFEAIDEGTLTRIMVPEGTENVAVGTIIAMMAGEGEEVSEAASTPAPTPAPAPAAETAAPAKPKAEPKADPEIPHGTNMATVTVREALRDA